MNTRQKKKITLFKKFSTNLEHVKTYLGLSIKDGYSDNSYICPLSFRNFSIDGLKDKYEDQLTLEHSPPHSLGGKIIALTTKKLNDKSGFTLDDNLRKYISYIEYKNGKGSVDVKFKINDSSTFKGNISKNETPVFNFRYKKRHQGVSNFEKLITKDSKIKISFSVKRLKNIDLALLRVAYLIAFSELGYSFFFGGTKYINPNIQRIREQLLYTEKKLITEIPIFIEDFPDEFLGVNIIYSPKKYRSILVVFDLSSSNEKYRFGVILPGPDDYGFNAYNAFLNNLSNSSKINFDAYTFPEKLDLTNKNDSIEYLKAWEYFNNFTTS